MKGDIIMLLVPGGKVCLLLGVCFTLILFTQASPLTNYIRHFEFLHYDHEALYAKHHVIKRSADGVISLDLDAFGRRFPLLLKTDTAVYSPQIEFSSSNSNLTFDTSRAYSGYLKYEESYVHGVITASGHFEGKIVTPNETYVVEKADRYFSEPHDHHTVIYRTSDVDFDLDRAFCGADTHRKHLQKFQYNLSHNVKLTSDRFHPVDRYMHYDPHYLHKRAIDPLKLTCALYLQADHKYYEKFGSNTDAVIEQLTQYVQTVNSIYKQIDFDGDNSADNINFIIKKIKIHTDPTAPGYRLNGNFGVEKFLELHSEENYDAFCLSYMFTYRDFDGGVLGLAWTAGENQAGGVCEKYMVIQGGSKSLNSGIVSTLNYGKDVPPYVSHLTLAHEIGHNFGSPHDADGTACAPGSPSGNFIMYAKATSGDKVNNNKFSSCSIGSMKTILETKARHEAGCFIEFQGTLCGNRVVETGEECDCGWEDDCTESCCNPQTTNSSAPTPCTRKASAVCSPSMGPCCANDCTYVTLAANQVCRHNTSCLDEAVCDGANFQTSCPPSTFKANKTPCGESQVCLNGMCSGAVCVAYGFPQCQCTPTQAGDWKDERLCTLCCQQGGECKPSYDIAGLPNTTAVPGTPCNDYNGYCDVFKRCREVDPSGPLNNLRKILLSQETLLTIKQWLTTYWYAGVGGGLALVIFMALFIKFCSKSVPTDRQVYEKKMKAIQEQQNMRMRYQSRTRNSVAPTGYM
ncbi:disintegrin and metalloproteinase domain-containing protein 10-like [Gigantopelta aegis]|uniref:disintegrin and metalloproteinase domain-containing protein 10-like n=1 Tax=Gigantopelta aegis TaxID=1735272 RepID=UPI001B8885DC|nr:disintegrin and metalloproteinase domain-containing protein 10-like [Gigantopelta aegis]